MKYSEIKNLKKGEFIHSKSGIEWSFQEIDKDDFLVVKIESYKSNINQLAVGQLECYSIDHALEYFSLGRLQKSNEEIEKILLQRYRMAAITYQCALRDGNQKTQLSTYQVLAEVQTILSLLQVDESKIEIVRDEVNAKFVKK